MTTPSTPAIALVTGASSGIGRAIALRLARDGYHVLAHYHRNEAGAQATLAELGDRGELIRFDVKDGASAEAALEAWTTARGDERFIEVLINNAGLHRDGLLAMMSDEMFEDVLRANAFGPFYLMRWCTRKMIRKRKGCVVNIASLAGQTGNAGQVNYAASKAALIAMTKSLASEVGSRGIRVNAVAPGFIETDMIANLPIPREAIVERIPLRRVGKPEEIAGAVAFLCSADAAYVTGHTLSVNGGLFPT